MPTSTHRFVLAGVKLELRASSAAQLADLAPGFAACRGEFETADLLVTIDRDEHFTDDRTRGPAYPSFERKLTETSTLQVSRYDVEGTIRLHPPATDGGPRVAAAFRASTEPASLDAAIRVAYSMAAPLRGCLLLHSSAVAHGGGAHVFSGVSGAGKSTIARLLAGQAGFALVADELVIVQRVPAPAGSAAAASWWCTPVPFRRCGGDPFHRALPLTSVNFLAQANTHDRTPIEAVSALPQLLRHVVSHVAEPVLAARVLELAAQLSEEIPCFALAFANEPSVAAVLAVT